MKCSVLLPVYNAGEPLREAVESILSQDELDFEFLIVEDCSTDGSAAMIRSFAQRDARIRAIFHERNAGLAATLNEGLREARCDFVARMDQDDVALPNRLSTQIRFLRTRPHVAVAGSFVYHMGRTAQLDRLVRLPVEHQGIAETLPTSNCLYHPSVMLRRDLILSLGGYRADFRNAEDYDLWLRTSRSYQLANIPVPLLRYRFSASGMTLGKKWQQAFYARMATVSFRHPEWSIEQVREQATLELEKIDKSDFLFVVARGTTEELLRLGQEEDARRTWRLFFRQLGLRQKLRLLATSGLHLRQLLNASPRRQGAGASNSMKRYDEVCTVCGAHDFLPFGQRSDDIRVLQCGACGHGIVEHFQDDVESLYGTGYFSASPDSPIGYTDYAYAADQGVAWAASLVRILKSGGDVLDIGCANGRALQLLGNGYNCFGIELNEDMAEKAREAGVRIIARDLLDSRVKEIYAGSFDAVLAIAVFEHLPDFKEAFRTATSLLKPDGILIFELPLIQAAGDVWYRSSLEHLHYPTRSSIEYLFREILHLPLTGSVIDAQDFGSLYVGLTSPDVETARLAGAEYLRLTSADPSSLSGEEIRFRWRLDLMHAGRSRPEVLALYRHLKPGDWNAFTLRRLFDLWACREEKLQNIQAYLAEVEKARDWHAGRAAAFEQLRSEGEKALADLRERLRDAESARDEYAAQLDAIKRHLKGPAT